MLSIHIPQSWKCSHDLTDMKIEVIVNLFFTAITKLHFRRGVLPDAGLGDVTVEGEGGWQTLPPRPRLAGCRGVDCSFQALTVTETEVTRTTVIKTKFSTLLSEDSGNKENQNETLRPRRHFVSHCSTENSIVQHGRVWMSNPLPTDRQYTICHTIT